MVITSSPIRNSIESPSIPSPINSRILFFTKPFPNTFAARARATSIEPTPGLGLPVRLTAMIGGLVRSYVFPSSCFTTSPPPSPIPMVPSAPYRVWLSEPKIIFPQPAIISLMY